MFSSILIVLALVACFVDQARADSQFSAELVRIDAAGEPLEKTGKVYVAGNTVRIATPDFPGDYFRADVAAGTSY